ncbi:MAG: SIS domain-containing protein [Clostridiales bacterium]|nr:SIS domain-containing protein [Clostridiales bacterium]
MEETVKYFEHITALLKTVLETQAQTIERVAKMVVDTSQAGNKIFVFGCSHAGILAQEAFYRTGGLVIMNPILARGLTCDVVPVTDTSVLERKAEYAQEIFKEYALEAGDLLIISSVSGRNGVPVEMGIAAAEAGVSTVAITNLTYSKASPSRHPSGKRLFEVCPVVIDNCGCIGDAAMNIDGFGGKVAPTSTITGAAIINSICAEAVAEFIKRGIEPPVFMSANLDGGDEYNAKIMEKYKAVIKYM